MVDFKALETLVWVATLQSFHKAAARLNTTQPAVSQRIAQLEAEVGQRLLVREKRQVVPTEAGLRVLDYAERLLKLRAEMLHTVADRSAIRGTLRLGVAETIVHTWLPRFVERMAKAYPGLVLEIEVDITPNLTPRLLAQEIELAFVLGPVSASGAHNHVLCDYPIGFLASPSLGLGDGPVARQDLARFPIITFPRKTQPYETVRALFNAPDLPPIRLHASTSLATVIHMANEGLGIAVIPSAIVENELSDGRLQLLDTDLKLPPLTFTASWLASPDAVAIERVAHLARQIAQASVAVDDARVARH